jgi:hypothetical protein
MTFFTSLQCPLLLDTTDVMVMPGGGTQSNELIKPI